MIKINNFNDFLNDEEKLILKKKCENFIPTSVPISYIEQKMTNYYTRYEIDINDPSMISIREKINNYVFKESKNLNIFLQKYWINKIDKTTNQDDSFHYDHSFMTFILYLNDDFEGGDFEYFDNGNKQIKIRKYLGILSDQELYHRVLPVTKGNRYSFVLFYDVIKKTKKTLT